MLSLRALSKLGPEELYKLLEAAGSRVEFSLHRLPEAETLLLHAEDFDGKYYLGSVSVLWTNGELTVARQHRLFEEPVRIWGSVSAEHGVIFNPLGHSGPRAHEERP